MPNQMIALQARNPQLPDPARQTAQYANMMNMTRQQEAAQLQGERARQEMEFARANEAREAELQPFKVTEAQAKANSERLKYVMDFYETSVIALSNSYNAPQAAALGDRMKQMFPEPELQQSIDETVAELTSDPANFEVNREKLVRRTLDAKDELARDYIKQTTGTEERLISVPKFGGGGATEVAGSRIQVAPGMTYVRGADGAIYPMPSKGAGSFGTSAPAVGDTFSKMIRQESRGNQFDRSGKPLTSSAGAVGIAQVMPGTAPEAARLAGLPFDDNRYRTDPEYNLALGKAYYEKQLADFGGDERLAAAAYNAGPGAVRSALQKGGPDGWINNVPRETRDYVKAVFGGAEQPSGRGAAGAPIPVIPGKPPAPAKPKPGEITPEAKLARDTAVQNLYDAIVNAQKKGHLTSEKQSYVANRAQEALRGRTYLPGGTAQKTSLDDIDTAATQLLRMFIQKGTSGTLNTKAEQDNFMRSVGGADASYETRLKTIRNFAKQNGIPLAETAAAKPKAAATKTPTKSSIPKDIADMYGL